MPRLKMLRGPFPGEEYKLDEAVMTIGRGHKNNIIIQDNEVSRTHCRLVRVLDDYEIHDLGSTNGTFVNGQKIDEGGWLLGEDSIIELGDSITLEYEPAEVGTGLQSTSRIAFYLVIAQESKETPELYILDRSTITIGRATDNDISIDEQEVSRNHMRLIQTSDGYLVEDLNTMNGTWVNGELIKEPEVLNSNDSIGVGTSVHMWFTDNPDSLLATLGTPDSITLMDVKPRPDDATREKPPDELRRTDARIKVGHELDSGDLMKSVFLMYARDEWNVIGSHIYTYLTDNNINAYTRQYLSPGTDDWDQALNQALIESPCLLAIVSSKSLKIPEITRTIRHFIAREKSVMILRYGRIDKLPTFIENMPSIRFDPQHPDTTYRIILAELRRIGL